MGKRRKRRPVVFKRDIRFGKQERIRIPQSPTRPYDIHKSNLLKKEFIKEDPWWWELHRRGPKRTKVGQDPLEARAVPKEQVRGTLPERILYMSLIRVMHFSPETDFDFQCHYWRHRVLTTDLRWVEARSLVAGDRLVALDEKGPRRKFREAIVLSNEIDEEPLWEVSLSDGTSLMTTANHPWLVMGDRRNDGKLVVGSTQTWATTAELYPGIVVPRFLDVWDENKSWESGWIAGMLDGEGSLVQSKQTAHKGFYRNLTMTQVAGPVLGLFEDLLADLNIPFSHYDNARYRSYDRAKMRQHTIRISGGRNGVMRVLGTFRPIRLLEKVDINTLGELRKIGAPKIVGIKPVGTQKICRLATSTKTYFTEGFAMHNSSLEGGRLELGGMVTDFLFFWMRIIIRVQGPTHTEHLRMRKDEEQRAILRSMGFQVWDIEDKLIYDEYMLEDWLRRKFGLRGGRGGSGGAHGPHDAEEEFDSELIEQILDGLRRADEKVDKVYAEFV